jgi:hypothetical protein
MDLRHWNIHLFCLLLQMPNRASHERKYLSLTITESLPKMKLHLLTQRPAVMMLIAGILTTFLCLPNSTIAQELAIDFGHNNGEIQIREDNTQTLRVFFQYNGITKFGVETVRGAFSEIGIPGAYTIGELGQPSLPATKKLIEIPHGADVSVNIMAGSVTEYNLRDFNIMHPLMPVQPSIRKDQQAEDIPFEYDETTYSTDAFVAHEPAFVEVLGVMRGVRIARLTVAPVAYNPVSGVIRVMNDIEVEVNFHNVDHAMNADIKASTWSPYFDVVQNSLLNNLTVGYPGHPDLTKYPVKYLIVSPRMFESDLQPFIQWKTQKGFEVITGYTDQIGTTFAAIQNWVHSQYHAATPESPAPSFLLIVGDTPQIPAQMGSSSGKMTDLYYASVDGDYFPEMYYGRFSATTSAQLVAQIAKTMYYEKYEFADPSYLDNVTLIAGADGTWNPRIGQPTVLYGTNNYFNAAHGYNAVNAYLSSYAGCYDPDRIAVSLINYTAHCGQTSWGSPQLTQGMVNSFVNNGKYPVAIGNCCLAADFGYSECIGETWQRALNKGSVAYIGSSPNSYWFEDFYWSVGAFPIQGTNNGYVPTFEETTLGVYDAPFVSNYVTTGSMVFVGNLAVTEVHIQNYPSHSSPLYYWQAYNVLGDPSLLPYHTQGSPNSVSHMEIMPIGFAGFEVSALPGSYVGISKDGVLHGAALVGPSGTVEVPITPVLTSGMVDIVVTGQQLIPYITQIPAAALEGAYVVLDGFTINDQTGNNNGLADFGEDILLNITLKNVGADPSGTVVAAVTGNSQYVTFNGPAAQSFGVIPAGGTATLDAAFGFSVAGFVPDQHQAVFQIEITDGTGNWTSNLTITLHAPELMIEDEFVIDDSQSGNSDGILDPGETALLMATVKNTGSSDVADVLLTVSSGDPFLTINTPEIAIPWLAAGEFQQVAVSVSADENTPEGHPANVTIAAAAGPESAYTADQTLTVVIGLVPEYFMSNQTVTTCTGLFYDSGGPDGQYGNNENFTMTFLPASANGKIKVDFLSFNTESNYDYFYVYNGSSTDAPQFAGSPFHGTANPGSFVGMNSDGAVTFKFTSDGSVTRAGWEAEISCFQITGPPDCAGDPVPADNAVNVPISIPLTWVSDYAPAFDVYFGTTPEPPFAATVSAPSYSPSLQPYTTYYWKVVPKNDIGNAEDCPVWSFTTGGPEYLMSNATVSVVNGMFYDSGGSDENYQNDEDYVMTFLPLIPGHSLVMEFLSFDIEQNATCNWDWLKIYDGPDTSSPLIGTYCGANSPGNVQATNDAGALTFHFYSDISVTRPGWAASIETEGTLEEQSILIPAGWSGISSCLIPQHPQLETLLAPIMDELVILQSMDGFFYPEEGTNTIGVWNHQQGYRIKTESPVQLEIAGWHSTQQTLTLNQGWSLMPVMTACELNPGVLFSDVGGTSVFVKEVAGVGIYWPALDINTIGNLKPGNAYYVRLGAAATIEFPSCGQVDE